MKYNIKKNLFSICLWLQNANENAFRGFGNSPIWFWKNFGNI